MTVDKFREMVQSHDITYEYSDDQRVWKKGSMERAAINAARKELGDEICAPVWNEKVMKMDKDVQKIYLWKTKGD